MEEIKIAPTKFWVIAAYKQGPDGFVKFWRPQPGWGEWVDDIARAKHYATLGTAKRENNKEDAGYIRGYGKVPMIQKYGNDVKFLVLEATAQVTLAVADQ